MQCFLFADNTCDNDDYWWHKDLFLCLSDKEILLSGKWLNNAIIHASQLLLAKQCQDITGWQSTLLSDSSFLFKPIRPNRKFIQILHTKSHWVMTSNIDVKNNTYFKDAVCIYDSLRPSRISFSVKRDICSFLKYPGELLFFDIINIEGQPNAQDCGLFSIACATELLYGHDPAAIKWDTIKMREHLLSCLDKKIMTRFPSHGKRRGQGLRILKRIKEQIYCTCRMPNDKTSEMIRCCNCHKWYHLHCVDVPKEQSLENLQWTCCLCIDFVEKIKIK